MFMRFISLVVTLMAIEYLFFFNTKVPQQKSGAQSRDYNEVWSEQRVEVMHSSQSTIFEQNQSISLALIDINEYLTGNNTVKETYYCQYN